METGIRTGRLRNRVSIISMSNGFFSSSNLPDRLLLKEKRISFLGANAARGVKLIALLHIVQMLRTLGAIPPLSRMVLNKGQEKPYLHFHTKIKIDSYFNL